MPAFVRKRGAKYRVVHRGARGNPILLRNRGGTPVDGGGHRSKAKATRQARAINST